MDSTKQDKRSIVRRRTQQLVYLELGRENGGVMLNLSEHGCGFQAITPVKCGETRFAFQINGGRRIAGDAEVVWADEAGIMGGLRFLNLPVEAHREIRLWLNETNAPPEPGFVPVGASVEAGARRSRAAGSGGAAAAAAATATAGVHVAQEELPPVLPPPAWLNLRAGNYGSMDERASFHHPEVPFGEPHRSASVWRGIALTATVVALAALAIVYQREVGTSLIWVGETLTGKTRASAVESDKRSVSTPAPTVPTPLPDTRAENPAGNAPVDKDPSHTQDAMRNADKDLGLGKDTDVDSLGTAKGLGGVAPPQANERPQSVLERQGLPPKTEAAFNAGDSVESLWGAVQAGSVAAEVSLAERFAHGEGVNKNCDQAKVLMKAAADRGNREARLRLYQMEVGGCR